MAAQDLLLNLILTIFFGDDPMLLTSLLQGTSYIKYHNYDSNNPSDWNTQSKDMHLLFSDKIYY